MRHAEHVRKRRAVERAVLGELLCELRVIHERLRRWSSLERALKGAGGIELVRELLLEFFESLDLVRRSGATGGREIALHRPEFAGDDGRLPTIRPLELEILLNRRVLREDLRSADAAIHEIRRNRPNDRVAPALVDPASEHEGCGQGPEVHPPRHRVPAAAPMLRNAQEHDREGDGRNGPEQQLAADPDRDPEEPGVPENPAERLAALGTSDRPCEQRGELRALLARREGGENGDHLIDETFPSIVHGRSLFLGSVTQRLRNTDEGRDEHETCRDSNPHIARDGLRPVPLVHGVDRALERVST